MKHHPSWGIRAAGAAAAGLALAGTALAVVPSSSLAAAPTCRAGDLYVVKGRLEGAAGNRYLTVRLTNVGDATCSAGVATRAGFRDFSGPLGVKGALSGGTGSVTLDPGETARTVIHWTDPGPVPPSQCDEAAATLVTLRVPSLGHTWRLPLKAQVCTTPDFAPDSKSLQ